MTEFVTRPRPEGGTEPLEVEMSPAEELALLFRAGHGLVLIESHEESRAIRLVQEACRLVGRRCLAWTLVQGLVEIEHGRPGRDGRPGEDRVRDIGGGRKPIEALGGLARERGPRTAMLLDFHEHLDDPEVRRALREVVDKAGSDPDGATIVLVAPVIEIPVTLEREAVHFNLPLPDTEHLERIVREVYRHLQATAPGSIEAKVRKQDLDRMTEAMLGLTEDEARRLVAQVILRDGRLDIDDLEEIRESKRNAVANQGKLEYVPVSDDLSALGGLERLKTWLSRRRDSFTPAARKFGLQPPRGMLLLGVPGCGKSLCARLVAGEWRRPLLRLDTGSLYNKFVGASETNLRESLRQAEASAPCVLWIDEIEKAFASVAGGSNDGGVSQRLFGTMLNWMNDRTADVFMVATANQVKQLPPELLRKGRFDEIFFVDLPPAAAREQILRIHLEKRNRDPELFDLPRLIDVTQGFSGAEIEQAIVAALYRAWDERRELEVRHIEAVVGETRPMVVTMSEMIRNLRAWAEDRCVMAHASEPHRA